MRSLWNEIRFGFRILLKSKSTSLVCILILGLAIGSNTAIFSIIHGILLRPLPLGEPDRLLYLRETTPQVQDYAVSYLNYLDWCEQSRSFEDLTAFRHASFTVLGGEAPLKVSGSMVSGNFFRTLRATAAIGRTLTPEDNRPEAEPAAVVSHGLWQRRFGGGRSVADERLSIDGRVFAVVGVMPPGFEAPLQAETEVWVPIRLWEFERFMKDRGVADSTYVFGRLKPRVGLQEARQEMVAVVDRLAERYPDTNRGLGIYVVPVLDEMLGPLRPALSILFVAGILVMLIACANVAHILLARSVDRRQEVATRIALGAGRGRIARQFLVESLLLGVLGGLVGAVLASWGLRALLPLLPDDIPRLARVAIDSRVLAFTAVVAFGSSLIFGLIPALWVSRGNLAEFLQESGRGFQPGRIRRTGRLLVASEVTLSLTLLVGAALLIASFFQLSRENPGLDTRDVLCAKTSLPSLKYGTSRQQLAFFDQALDKIRSLPAVDSAAFVRPLPLSGSSSTAGFVIEGQPPPTVEQQRKTEKIRVTEEYFETLGIPLLAGRLFDHRDRAGSKPVAIVGEKFAASLWPGEDAVGKRVKLNFNPAASLPWLEVVGTVGHVKHKGIASESHIQLYLPLAQSTTSTASLVIKSSTPPESLISAVRQAVQEADPDQPLYDVMPLAAHLASTTATTRAAMMMLSVFAAVALLLALVGVYGVMAYSVEQRAHEICLRLALGAEPVSIRRMLLAEASAMVGLGLLAGLLISFLLTPSISGFLYGLTARDPRILLGSALLLLAAGLLATGFPAYKASRRPPTPILR